MAGDHDAGEGAHAHEAGVAERRARPSTPTTRFRDTARHDVGADGNELAGQSELEMKPGPSEDRHGDERQDDDRDRCVADDGLSASGGSADLDTHALTYTFSFTGLPSRPAGRIEQHDDEHGEHHGVGELRGDVGAREDLDDAEQHAAERARRGWTRCRRAPPP